MPPALFSYKHLIFLTLLGFVLWCALSVCRKARRPIFRFGSAVIAGAVAGILLSYLGAHGVLLMMRSWGGVTGDPGYAFFGLFIGMAMIGVIAGGLVGILVLKRRDEKSADGPDSDSEVRDGTGKSKEAPDEIPEIKPPPSIPENPPEAPSAE